MVLLLSVYASHHYCSDRVFHIFFTATLRSPPGRDLINLPYVYYLYGTVALCFVSL